ncbi:MAG: serine/threonine-protein phosphatase [Victivallales bacterium]|nr:serine/threonine-protein phosphatase [Victivallales bacterium]
MPNDAPYNYVTVAAISDMGLVRTNNEDSFLSLPEAGLFVVADGMGGGEAGEIASATVIDNLKQAGMASMEDSPGARKYAIQQALHKANAKVVNYMQKNNFNSMGSTVVLMLLNPWNAEQALVCHVGDSRIFCFRNGELFQLTQDHSVGEEIRKKGLPQVPSKIAKALTRVIGGTGHLVPEWNDIAICPDDIYIICSDGISPILSEEEMTQIITATMQPEIIVKQLKQAVHAKGAPDNLTAVCIKTAHSLPLPADIDKWEREESDLLLKVAEERKDYGTN